MTTGGAHDEPGEQQELLPGLVRATARAARARGPAKVPAVVEPAATVEPVELDDTDRMLARLLGAVRIA